MKRIKYSIFILLILVGFLFNGELFILHLDNFQEAFYRASFAFTADMSADIPDEEVVQDFQAAGKIYNVDFFMVDSNIKSAFEKDITIYGTDNVFEHLRENEIFEKEYPSLVLGRTRVRFQPFDNIKNIQKYQNCYFLGDASKYEDLRLFKADLIDKYGGGFPKIYGSNKETRLNMLLVWGIIFFVILMMTVYEIIYQRKEVLIRIISGDNPRIIFAKNIIIDTSVFLLAFLVIPILIKGLTNVYFGISWVCIFFGAFLILNIAINGIILIVNFKKDISNSRSGKELLSANYTLKTLTTIITIVLLSSNFIIFSHGYNLYQQKNFIEAHSNYSYYQLNYRTNNLLNRTIQDTDMMNQAFYKRFQEKSLQFVDLTGNLDKTYPIILVNRTSMNEIANEWSAFSDSYIAAKEKTICLFIPSGISRDSTAYNFATDMIYAFFRDYVNNFETIEYNGNINLVGVYNMGYYNSTMIKNPIILFNNTIPLPDEEHAQRAMSYAYSTMYDIPDEDFEGFVSEFQLDDQIVVNTNVLDAYQFNRDIISRGLRSVLVLSLFLLFLEMTLIVFIIRMEYQFNSVEMALKKVYGYTFFERYKRLISITLLCFILSVLGAFIIAPVFGVKEGLSLIGSGLVLLILELSYIVKKAKSVEQMHIAAILKGERI